MKTYLSYFLLLPILSACSSGYVIRGTTSINDFEGKWVRLKALQDDSLVVLDSTEVVHNTFSMRGHVDSVQLVTLFLDEQGVMPIVLEEGTIQIVMDADKRVASGTLLNDALYGFISQMYALEAQLNEVARKSARLVLDGFSAEDAEQQVQAEQDSLELRKNEVVSDFLRANYETALGPEVFLMICSSSFPYPMLTPQVKEWLNNAPYSFKNHPMVRLYIRQAEDNMKRIEEERLMRNR